MTATPRARSGAASRRAAWTALVLALLVPARAVALCCVDALSEWGPAARPHGEAHHAPRSHGEAHHAAERGEVDGAELSADSSARDCGSIEALAPAVRERGPAGGVPATVSATIGLSATANEPRPTAFRPAPARAVDPLPPALVSLRI